MRSLGRAIKNFSADDMLVYAAALSYQLFFSLFPFVIFLLALLGVLNLTSIFDWLIKQSQTVLPGQALGLMQNIIGQIRGQAASGTLSLGAVLALGSASAAVRMAMHALNAVGDVEDRAVWKKFPLSLIYTVLLAVLVIAAAAMMLIGPQLASWIAQQVGMGSVFATVWTWARIPVAVVLLMLVAALIYYLFPNTNQPFRFVTPGAVLAMIV
jgi:membrane protein